MQARARALSDRADHIEEVGAVLRHRLHIVEGKLGLFAHAIQRVHAIKKSEQARQALPKSFAPLATH